MRLIDADALLEYLDLMYDTQYDWTDSYNTGVLGAIYYIKHKAPTIDAVSGWIPCEEMLPREYSNDERVLATTDVDGLGVILMPIYDVVSWYRKGYISAWMPLPKPYGEREGE